MRNSFQKVDFLKFENLIILTRPQLFEMYSDIVNTSKRLREDINSPRYKRIEAKVNAFKIAYEKFANNPPGEYVHNITIFFDKSFDKYEVLEKIINFIEERGWDKTKNYNLTKTQKNSYCVRFLLEDNENSSACVYWRMLMRE